MAICRYNLVLVVSLIFSTVAFSQNALRSAEFIFYNKSKKELLDTVLKEIARYSNKNEKLRTSDLMNPFNFKSHFLQDYFEHMVAGSKAQVILDQKPKEEYAEKIDQILQTTISPNYTVNTRLSYDTIIDQLENYARRDSVFNNKYKLKLKEITDSINAFSLKDFIQTKRPLDAPGVKNPKDIFTNIISSPIPAINNTFYEIKNTQGIQNALKLPSQSDLVDALAIFLVKRVKQESVIAFVEQLNKNIDKLEPLPCLFKNTAKELSSFAPGQVDNFGSVTQKAIALDLANMPDNVANCEFCGNDNTVKKFSPYTKFIEDISTGVDLITSIQYHASAEGTSDNKFQYVLKLLDFINKYYSNIYNAGESNSTWITPMEIDTRNDSILKLSLALVYEKEKIIFDNFLQTRFDCTNLDSLFNKKEKFTDFKANFSKTFFSLHKLDSYWRSHRDGGKTVVEMPVYLERVQEVIKDVFTFMNYEESLFPANNKLYQFYNKAKEAVANKDVQGIVYYAQQMLDAMGCYEFRMRGFKLPGWSLKKRTLLSCKDTTYASTLEIAEVNGSKGTRLNRFETVNNFLASSEKVSHYIQEWLCNSTAPKSHWLKKWHTKFSNHLVKNHFDSSLSVCFHPSPWLHPFTFVFRHKEWKLGRNIKRAIKTHESRKKLKTPKNKEDNSDFICFLEQEKNLQNNFSYGSSRRKVSQMLNFFTDLQKATDNKQISQVIEKYAEPVQSYRIKRYNNFSLDLNAYTGAFAGIETRAGKGYMPYSKDSITKVVSGITAPVGFSFSWAWRHKFKCENAKKYPVYINKSGDLKSFKGGCFTASFMLIDIGAVVAYRFTNDTSKALPQTVKFSQFLAPGLHVAQGLRNLPLVIKAGIQYTPQLRNFEDEPGRLFDVYRIGLSLCYDIPLLNITNSNKRLMRSNDLSE